jgi:hypothetical protein
MHQIEFPIPKPKTPEQVNQALARVYLAECRRILAREKSNKG